MRLLLRTGVWVAVIVFGSPLLDHPLRALHAIARRPPTSLLVPVRGVAAEALRDSWDVPRSGGRRHRGIDIFAPRGTPVLAATAGVVWSIGRNRLGGNVVWLLGPGGQLHYYAHLDSIAAVRTGTVVAAGDALGTVGDTGNARGGSPHLHYGIYAPAHGAINPFPLLAAARVEAGVSPAARP